MERLSARRFERVCGIGPLFLLNGVISATGYPEHYNTVEVGRVLCHGANPEARIRGPVVLLDLTPVSELQSSKPYRNLSVPPLWIERCS